MESFVCSFENLRLRITAEYDGITGMEFVTEREDNSDASDSELIAECVRQLREYFAGERREFSLPLKPYGTEFQRRVWVALREIPYGETRTYKEIAERVGNAKASRAVGMACHRNPIVILVPCHRVLGSDGKLTGFAGGLDVKRELLELEGVKIG